MNANDYKEALEMTDKLESSKAVVNKHGPVTDIEAQVTGTLWDFMNTIFSRVHEDYSFKEEIREELRARISEMDVGMLMGLYNRLNEHETDAIRTALAPFMPKEGKGSEGSNTTLLDTLRSAQDSPEQALHDQADAEVLRGIQHLNMLLAQTNQENGNNGHEES